MKVKVIDRTGISGILNILLLILLIAGILIYATIPFWLQGYLHWRRVTDPEYYRSMLILLYSAGIPALFILLQAKRLVHNVNTKRAFVQENARYLFWIGISSAVIALLFLLFIPSIFSVFSVVIVIIFILLSLIALILAELFKIATRYKEENELTI